MHTQGNPQQDLARPHHCYHNRILYLQLYLNETELAKRRQLSYIYRPSFSTTARLMTHAFIVPDMRRRKQNQNHRYL